MKVLEFPNFTQSTDYTCGASCLLSILYYYGIQDYQEIDLEKLISATPEDGASVDNIKKFLRKKKFLIDAGVMKISTIQKYIDQEIPVLVVMQAWASKKNINYAKTKVNGHYVVVIGYNKEYLFFTDPVLENIWYLPKKEFESRWHDHDNQGNDYINYGIAIHGKKPDYNELILEKIE